MNDDDMVEVVMTMVEARDLVDYLTGADRNERAPGHQAAVRLRELLVAALKGDLE